MSEQKTETQTQTETLTRKLMVEIGNTTLGSPNLYRRWIEVKFATEPPPPAFKTLLDELDAAKRKLEYVLGALRDVARPIIETHLERMVNLARENILRPRSTRWVSVSWTVKGAVSGFVTSDEIKKVEVVVEVRYDPPIITKLYYDGIGLEITVIFLGKRKSCYRRPVCLRSDVLKPIDVLTLLLTVEVLEMVMKMIQVWFLVGEEKAMVVRLRGKKYIVATEYDPSLLSQPSSISIDCPERQQQEQQQQQQEQQQAQSQAQSSEPKQS